jgi:CRISPR-associated protein (TIGR02710 family)
MTVGTGIGTDHEDTIKKLIESCSFALLSYKPNQVIYFCTKESMEIIPRIEETFENKALKISFNSSKCMIPDPSDFTHCFELIYEVASLYQDEEIVIEASTGTREMIMAAEIVSFLNRIPVSHVTGEKVNGMIVTGSERNKQMLLYAAYDRLKLHQAIYAFNKNHYGSAIRLIGSIDSVPERDIYYGLFNGYWYWDKMNYEKAYKYLEHAPDINPLISLNTRFLNQLIYLDKIDDSVMDRKKRLKIRQQKYIYVLIDLLHNAKRRIDGEHYDDALARLYRVVELISQVLLLNYGIDDNEEKIRFADLKKILKRQYISLYARKADRRGIVRIGLRFKFLLLEDLGMKGADRWYYELQNYIMARNDSILAHGITPVNGEMVIQMWEKVRRIIKEACLEMKVDLEDLYQSSDFPNL